MANDVPRRVALLSVALDAVEHRKLLELTASRMVADGRRVTVAETVRTLIREAPQPRMSPGPRAA